VSSRINNAVIAADPAFPPGRAASIDRQNSIAAPVAPDFVDVAFEPVLVPFRPPAVAAPPATTADEARLEVLMTLDSERRAELGEYNHRHTAGDCGYCRRAVAAYR